MRRHLKRTWLTRVRRHEVEPMEWRVLLSAGDLDRTFSGDGVATTNLGGGDAAAAVVLLPGGGTLFAGGGGRQTDFAVTRYLPDGSLDRSFGGGDGVATGGFARGDRLSARATDLTVLPDGKILVVGVFTEDGTWPGDFTARAAAPASGGGNGWAAFADEGEVVTYIGSVDDSFAVARFNPDGSIDRTFGDAGHVITFFSGNDYAEAVAVQPDGKFIVAGQSAAGLSVVRYQPDGAVDATFGRSGHVQGPEGSQAFDVAFVGEKIVVAGSYGGELALVRYNLDGSLDMTYGGGDGVATARFGKSDADNLGSHAEALAVQSDGKVVAAGVVQVNGGPDGEDVAVARFNRDGSLDATFGAGGSEGDGKVLLSRPDRAHATGVAIAPRGQILLSVGIYPYLGGAFSVARLTADGTLDPTYGRGGADGDGFASANFGAGGGGYAAALAVLADGRAVAAGGAGGDFALARFAADAPGRDGDGNDQLFEATRLRVGATWSQTISGKADVDLYRFAATTGQRVGFDVDEGAGGGGGGGTGGALDSYLRIFAPDGTELLSNDNGAAPGEAAGVGAYAEFTFSAGGTYYVAVSWASNRAYDPVTGAGDATGGSTVGASGAFTLTLADRTQRPPADGDDQLSEAASTRVGAAVTGKGLTALDVDVFKFAARAGQRVAFDTSGASGQHPDTYLRLFAAGGAELAANDNGAAPGEATADGGSYLEFTFSAAGTYYVAVSGAPNTAYDPVTGRNDIAGGMGAYVLRLIDRPAGPAAPPAPPPGGRLDTTFGGDGTVLTDVPGVFGRARAVAVQGDGRIVVAGAAFPNGQSDFAVARYLSDGRLDPGFGGGSGIVTTDFGSNGEEAYAVAVLPGGKILVAGSAGPVFGDLDFAIARYNADGSPDTSFGGGDGKVTTSFGSPGDEARALALLPGGKFLVAGQGGQAEGENWTGVVVARYRADGALDRGFGGGDGFALTFVSDRSAGATSMAVLPDGKIVVGGAAVVRYLPDGTLDTAYGNNGVAVGWGRGGDVVAQDYGRIVLYSVGDGYLSEPLVALVRLDDTGRLDPTFGLHYGVTELPLGRDAARIVGAAALPGGRIVLAGQGRSTVNAKSRLADVFSPSNPSPAPNGTYAFGYKPSRTGAFTRFDGYRRDPVQPQFASHAVAGDVAGAPGVSKNLGAQWLAVGDAFSVAGGEVGLSPGADGPRQYATVRFTAARAGQYFVHANFEGRTSNIQAADVAVIAGGEVRWSTVLNYRPDHALFVSDLELAAGEAVDFVVGNGGDGAAGDFIALDVQVEYAPRAEHDFVVARYTRDGLPDTSFDGTAANPGDGIVYTDMGGIDGALAVAVQPDGRLVVAGATGTAVNYGEPRGFAVARYLGEPRGADGDADDQLSESRRVSAAGTPVNNSLTGAADVDVYELVVPEAGRRIGFDVDGPLTGAPDALLRLFTRDGAELALNDSGAAAGESPGVSPYLEFTFSAPGTYYVGVSSSGNRRYNSVTGGGDAGGGAAGGSYTLSLADRTPTAADGDDQLKEARPTVIGTVAEGKIDRATDVDVLSFTVATGQRVALDVATLSGALRPHLRLLAEDGTELAAGDAGATVNGSSLEFTFSAVGTYYAAVSSRPNVAYDAVTGGNDAGAGGAAGTYRLRLRDLTPGSLLLQAEDAAIAGAKVTADHAGYTATGYVDFVNTGDYVEWSLTVPSAGPYTLAFRYANGGSKNRPLQLRVNGQGLSPVVPFQPTGGWTMWKNVSLPVGLNAGTNTVRLTAVALSGPNIDLLNVVPAPR